MYYEHMSNPDTHSKENNDNEFEGVKELADAAEQILRAGGASQEKATVTDYPNERTIRYYMTEGLLPPSVEKRGSTSVYGYQHLLSLLVIKKLQADGLPISIIRQLITGKSEDELKALLGDKPVDDSGREPVAGSAKDTAEEISFARPMMSAPPAASEPTTRPPEKNAAREYLEGLLLSRSSGTQSPAAPQSAAPPHTNSWRREEVSPGLELHIRDDYQVPGGYRNMKKLLQLIKDLLRRQ